MDALLELGFTISQEYIFRELGLIVGAQNFTPLNPFHRYFSPRKLGWGNSRFTILVGPRGIGKTRTLLEEIRDHYQVSYLEGPDNRGLYLPMDDYRLNGISLYEIGCLYASYGKGQYLLVDEIHKYQNWAQELKSLYDRFPKLKIVVSGSSLLEITKTSHDLSRRAVVKRVYGMSFREYLLLKYHDNQQVRDCLNTFMYGISHDWNTFVQDKHVRAEEVSQLLESHNIYVLSEFDQYCKTGYYPYFYEHKHEDNFRKTLQQQVSTTIEADIPSCYPKFTGASTRKIGKLLAFLAQSVPYTPNYRELKHVLDIGDERTLKEYLYILEKAQLIQPINKYYKGFKQLKEAGKYLLHNPNLQWALSNRTDIGTRREIFMASMLVAVHELADIEVTMPESGDFQIQHQGKVFTIEVGSARKTQKQIYGTAQLIIAKDSVTVSRKNEIPLWFFGFLY